MSSLKYYQDRIVQLRNENAALRAKVRMVEGEFSSLIAQQQIALGKAATALEGARYSEQPCAQYCRRVVGEIQDAAARILKGGQS